MERLIKGKIEEAFKPEHLEIINESHKHAGHAGDDGSGQTHFKLMVVSDEFEGRTRVQRHKEINESIKPLFNEGLHAISIHVFTPQEYKKKKKSP